ncbi:hybrid sensor histidine kinase/response regulator [Myxococcus sp. Y35]|uniref:hybrid sensor histidine kinase/response regulator n=1 Tax=Pseudomyxococcus flavus TaxID=3115648 RepID=UPI003CEE74B2
MEQEDTRQHRPGAVSNSRTLLERLKAAAANLERLCSEEDVHEALQDEAASLRRMHDELAALLEHFSLERAQRNARLREELERELQQGPLGLVVAGIVHELSNPLAYTTGNLEYLQQRLLDPALPASLAEECRQVLDESLEGARHIRRVVADIRDFSRGASGGGETPVDLQAVLERTLRMAASHLRHRARVVKDYGASVPRVLGTETRLSQVALNLVLNAAQAMPENRVSENALTVALREEGDGVVLSISDTGRGIAPDLLPHIFEPYFTTRGEGMGMGLAICREFVKALGGTIHVRSEPGKGTTVEVRLRRAEPPAPPMATKPTVAAARPRRILVVDNEPRTVDRLRHLVHGYDLVTAAHGCEALERLRARADFDAILCDLGLPEMTGMEFYERVRTSWPGLHERIVFTTSGVFTSELQHFLQQVKNPLLTKPFEPQRLQGVLASTDEHLGH